jgi:hypothetical protein
MDQGDIVVERLTGKHVILLESVDREWVCRFADGRQENRRAFELAPSPLARFIEWSAVAAGGMAALFGWIQGGLAVAVPPPLALVTRRRHEAPVQPQYDAAS